MALTGSATAASTEMNRNKALKVRIASPFIAVLIKEID
jgi:hypothetical protein